jgi:nicotinamide-nucleotide amidase
MQYFQKLYINAVQLHSSNQFNPFFGYLFFWCPILRIPAGADLFNVIMNQVFNMATAEILTIGSELIDGLRTDTNATWLAKRLTNMGIRVAQITSVGDIVEDVVGAIRGAIARLPDLLIITGGLGPTIDDRTSKALARATRRNLVLNPAALDIVKMAYARQHARGLAPHKWLTPARKKMAFLPDGATALPNPVGTAPGIEIKEGKTIVVCLPGVPAEMRGIFTTYVREDLAKLKNQVKHRVSIEVLGIEESTLAPLFDRLSKKFRRVDVRSYPSMHGERGRVKVILVAPTTGEAKDAETVFNSWLKRISTA